MDGVALTVVAVGGSGKLSYPGVPVANRGGYSTSGSNTFGQGNQRRQFRYEIEVDKGQTTIESEAPYVLVQVSGVSRDQRLSLRVKNDAGGEVQLAGPRTFASSLYVWFMDITEDAKALNAEVIVHRCRTFTFLVAPPQIGPPQPSVPSRSPRSAEQRLADARRAIDSNQRALAANPANANVLNNLAWAYVTAPEELRDADQAVSFAQRATQLNPGDYNSLNTLGTAYYRAGQYDLALSTLERNAAARTDSLVVFDLYPLAMTQFQLEQSDKAKETYQRALDLHRRIETDLSLNHWQELYEFRIEAATLLLGEPPQAVFERAGQLAREGKWEPAADEFAKGLEIYPVDHWQWYRAGALQAYRNQPEEFRDICRKMLDLFGDTNDPFIAERAGKLALLLPDALPGDARPAQLCDKSASWRPDVPWFQLASAIARYRDKKYQDALARLQTAEAQVGNQVYCHVLIELFRAMSLHRLEQQEAARQSLEAALRRLGEITPKPPEAEEATLDYGSGWHDYLMCEVVRREAETLVGDETVP